MDVGPFAEGISVRLLSLQDRRRYLSVQGRADQPDQSLVVIFTVEQIPIILMLAAIFLSRTTTCSVVVFHGASFFFAAVLPHTGFFNAVAAIVWKGEVVSHESTWTGITLSSVLGQAWPLIATFHTVFLYRGRPVIRNSSARKSGCSGGRKLVFRGYRGDF